MLGKSMIMMRNTAVAAALAAGLAACGGSDGGGGLDPGGGEPPPGGESVPEIALDRVFPALSFNEPTVLKQAPNDATRWFVGEKSGVIRVFANNAESSSASVFLDISAATDAAGEGGLLGFAFHPDFPLTPEVYVSYTRSGSPLVSYLSRFTSTDNGLSLNAGSEEVILTVLQPAANHNGGDLHFGPDGLLYAGFGDGGGAGDPAGNGQDDTNLHGTVIRIDVDSAADYDIPAGNPNAANSKCTQGYGSAPCPEIFAWGFRNPWRLSFDSGTGKLWAGDVGQNAWEEIDVVQNGQNFGWNVREGAHCFSPATGCATDFREPITEYGRDLGVSVTGGYVYRGSDVPDLVGWYVFGDFGSGRIFAIREDSPDGVTPEVLLETSHAIVTFGTDTAGELYFADWSVGTIHKVETAP